MREFEWMMDSEENHYSSWYKELLRTGESTMSEETFRKIASIFDIDADTIVEEITTLRKNFKQELIDMYEEDVETFTDISVDAYVQNAFPYEFILKDRY
jgi:dynactin complex subunit